MGWKSDRMEERYGISEPATFVAHVRRSSNPLHLPLR